MLLRAGYGTFLAGWERLLAAIDSPEYNMRQSKGNRVIMTPDFTL